MSIDVGALGLGGGGVGGGWRRADRAMNVPVRPIPAELYPQTQCTSRQESNEVWKDTPRQCLPMYPNLDLLPTHHLQLLPLPLHLLN